MRCEGLLLFLSVVRVRVRVRARRQDCSEEFRRERQLYPLCVPSTCGKVVRDISQGSVITLNTSQSATNFNHQTLMNTSSSVSLLVTTAPKSMDPPNVQSLLSLEYLKLPHPGIFLLKIQTGEVGRDILPIICNSPHTVKSTGGGGG